MNQGFMQEAFHGAQANGANREVAIAARGCGWDPQLVFLVAYQSFSTSLSTLCSASLAIRSMNRFRIRSRRAWNFDCCSGLRNGVIFASKELPISLSRSTLRSELR